MENLMPSSTSVLDYFPDSNHNALTGLLDYSERSNSLGFMELLNMQDFGPASLSDHVRQLPIQASPTQPHTNFQALPFDESLRVLNEPPTPNNSSSVSSQSNGGQNGEVVVKHRREGGGEEEEEEEEQHQKTQKQLKSKKIIQKKHREPRIAFMTKSEVDHLEDGYRWRKYGQKAVKNSPFPRSYYKCTSASCNVKKRIERSLNDPSIVVTTYQGQHTHESTTPPRWSGLTVAAPPCFAFSSAGIGKAPYHPSPQMLLSAHHHIPFSSNPFVQDMVPWPIPIVKRED